MIEWRRVRLRDLGAEALAGMIQRPARSALTTLGTALGIGTFVAILGVTATASSQIDSRFTALAATEVVIEDVGDPDEPTSSVSFPADASSRIEVLNGVVHAGMWWPVPKHDHAVVTTPTSGENTNDVTLFAAEHGAVAAMHPVMQQGRLYDQFHVDRAERVVVLGAIAAASLGISRIDGQAVFIDGDPYVVLGIIANVGRLPDTLFGVLIPQTTALSEFGPPAETRVRMLIETELGAARLIASQAAVQLRPEAPQRFRVVAAPDPSTLRSDVRNDVHLLFLLVAAISSTVGAIGIANISLVGVVERTAEIGLRRSLGARPWHIAVQFVAESTALGLLGGLVGTSFGVGVVVAVALAKHWTAIVEPSSVLAAPLVGAIAGLIAGAYPGLRAARIEPVNALRR